MFRRDWAFNTLMVALLPVSIVPARYDSRSSASPLANACETWFSKYCMSDFTVVAETGPCPTLDGSPLSVMAESGTDTSVERVVDSTGVEVLVDVDNATGPSTFAGSIDAAGGAEEEHADTMAPAAINPTAHMRMRPSFEVSDRTITPCPSRP